MALTTKRIIALTTQSDPQEGDYLAIDNATSGTHKIPVGRIGVELDDTLTEQGKAADAKAVGDALDEIRSQVEATDDAIDEIRSQIEVTGTASGAIATFSDGSTMPMKSCIVSIEPQQSGSGTPSPDNVRRISGWESVVTSVSGKNVYSGESNIIIDRPLERGTTLYTQVFDGTFTNATLYAKTPTNDWVGIDSFSQFKHTLTINRDDILEIKISNSAYSDLNNAGSHLMVSFTDFDTYEPYTGTTTTTSLGRTVYGGTLDIVSGELKVTHLVTDMSGLTWTVSDTNIFKTTSLFDVMVSKTSIDASDNTIMCSAYAYIGVRYESSLNDTNICRGLDNTIRVYDSRYTTTSDFVSAISGYQLVYELATPQTYQLTPTQINTLLGENNVWADSGDVEVVYVRDLNITINNLLNSNGTRSLGMMMSAPTEAPTDEQTEEPAEDDMR